jgi:hypothetical protein
VDVSYWSSSLHRNLGGGESAEKAITAPSTSCRPTTGYGPSLRGTRGCAKTGETRLSRERLTAQVMTAMAPAVRLHNCDMRRACCASGACDRLGELSSRSLCSLGQKGESKGSAYSAIDARIASSAPSGRRPRAKPSTLDRRRPETTLRREGLARWTSWLLQPSGTLRCEEIQQGSKIPPSDIPHLNRSIAWANPNRSSKFGARLLRVQRATVWRLPLPTNRS